MNDSFLLSPDFHGILAVIVGMSLIGIPLLIVAYRMGRRLPAATVVRDQAPSALQERLAAEGVFKGFHGLEGLANNDEFWQEQPYGTRLYYGSGGLDYLHRDVLRVAVRALRTQQSPKK